MSAGGFARLKVAEISVVELVQISHLSFTLIRQWQGMRRREQMRVSLEGKTNQMLQYITLNDGVERETNWESFSVFPSAIADPLSWKMGEGSF